MDLTWFFLPGYNWYYKPTKEKIYKVENYYVQKVNKLTYSRIYEEAKPKSIQIITSSGNKYLVPVNKINKYLIKLEAGGLVERALF
jgi:hypothetical protein